MEEITIDDFKKVEVKIGTIVSADIVPDADKLLVFKVDMGTEVRQILSGVREYYSDPSVLVGRQVPVVVNLAPRKIRGLESNGMILYVSGGDIFTTLEPRGEVPQGAEVR